MGCKFKMIAALLLLGSSSLALAQNGEWTVSEASGTVTASVNGQARTVSRGATVAPGTTLNTGAASRAVVVRGKDFVTIAANSRVRIPVVTEKRGMLSVIQEWGNAIFQIEKQAEPHFGVQTPYLAAVVKGTTFSITVTQQGASLQVVEGAVETSTLDGGAKDLIGPGVVASVNRDDIYRLTVQGQDTRQIDSPQRAVLPGRAAVDAAPGQAVPQGTPAPASSATQDAPAAPETVNDLMAPNSDAGEANAEPFEPQFISETINSAPVDLGKATDGLIAGNSGFAMANVDAATLRSAREDQAHSAAQAPAGNAGGSDNANAGGSDNANAGGSDNANAGGSDNANAGGGDNANAGGSDNANAGGGDNANAGGSDNANAGGSDNANAGGSDNANAGGGDNANAGGGKGTRNDDDD